MIYLRVSCVHCYFNVMPFLCMSLACRSLKKDQIERFRVRFENRYNKLGLLGQRSSHSQDWDT